MPGVQKKAEEPFPKICLRSRQSKISLYLIILVITIITKELGARRFACPFLINILIANRVLTAEGFTSELQVVQPPLLPLAPQPLTREQVQLPS